ncbi:hypothetical protein GCM10025781_16170 [Kocuria gwangalliensis]|uniref:Lipoprotein n=1 Tax=Kocuria gwangalliensis TaxID=501592 RepID=A0ABP8X1I8_9MICC
MRTTALKIVTGSCAVSLLLTACGGSTGSGGGDVTAPATQPSATATPSAVALPQLEAGQSDQELAFDFVDALNEWFQYGEEELEERLPENATPQVIAETAMEIARENSPQFSEALLVEDFDTRRPRFDGLYTTEGFEWWNASVINQTIDGHSDFYLDEQGEVQMTPIDDTHESYKLTLTVAQPVTSRPDDVMWIKVHRITDPAQELVPVDIKPIVAQFETDGDRERLASMQWG